MRQILNEFKQEYEQKGAHDLLLQVPYLSELASHYHRKGEADKDWVSLLKVRLCFVLLI